jgi:hypothetical protein
MLFAAEARTVFACISTSLNVYADSSYVYADASFSTGQCGVNCYEWIDLILTGPSNQSVEQTVDNGDNGRQVSVEEVVSTNRTWYVGGRRNLYHRRYILSEPGLPGTGGTQLHTGAGGSDRTLYSVLQHC